MVSIISNTTYMNKVLVKGTGKDCPKCSKPMERRVHRFQPKPETYFYKEWDYCKPCKHIQHYEGFKSGVWVKAENQQNFFSQLGKE